ncbi:MAG: hypothetical protein LBT73_02520 [Tannerellaceae bacterium]|jgi:hypothetical protein|nr:hypothetical protein [Tannerellaceae bacterium]
MARIQEIKRLGTLVVLSGAIMVGGMQGFAQRREAYPGSFPDGPYAHLDEKTTLTELAYITPDKATHPIPVYDPLTGASKGTTTKYYAFFYRYWTFFICEVPAEGQWNVCFSRNKPIPEAGFTTLPWNLIKLESPAVEQAVMSSFDGKWLPKFPSGELTPGEVVPFGTVVVDAVILYDFTQITELQMLRYIATETILISTVWDADKPRAWNYLMQNSEGWKEFNQNGRYGDEQIFFPNL